MSVTTLAIPFYSFRLSRLSQVLFSLLLTISTLSGFAQSRVDQLSDEQVQDFYRRAQSSGLSELQIEQAAMSQGYTMDDVTKMRRRIAQIRSRSPRSYQGSGDTDTSIVRSSPTGLSRRRLDSLGLPRTDSASLRSRVFGASLFQNASLSFEPDIRIATPRNYVVGPDDELLLDIYGASSENFRLRVTPEGTVKIPNLAPVIVSGLTVEQAEQRIIARLRQGGFQGLGTAGSGTYATASVGKIRSIRVTLVGEVVRPGTYTISSLGSAFNALYLAGGPNPETGSFRRIQVIRGNRIIRTIDLYDFLLRADQRDNIRLQDQDVIRVAEYQTRVDVQGEVRRPYLFELLPGETFQNLLSFAGGFNDEAYTASVSVRRNTARERQVINLAPEEFAQFTPKRGDRYTIGRILDRYENRVQIAGAVMRPGDYAIGNGITTVSELIRRADGLRKDAFTTRANIFREKENTDIENIPFDVAKLLNKEVADIPLQRQDSVVIQSIRSLREPYYVSIEGAINKPDTFNFADNMTVSDLITLAGGFQEGATANRLEIARRTRSDSTMEQDNTEIYRFSLDRTLSLNADDARFLLQPFDRVYVRTQPYYGNQQQVVVMGEVMHPGTYAILNQTERINDILARTGGLKPSAYLLGSQLKRNRQVVGTDIRAIIENPSSEGNLLLQDRDTLYIPRRSDVVTIQGAVLNPSIVSYEAGLSLKDYVSLAGGYTENARVGRSYVAYPNGRKDRTKRFIGLKSYPDIQPGSTVIVPFKPLDNARLSTIERVTILSVTGSLVLAVLNFLRR
ncbi:SLBB domain-containing protein [Fibrella forsythiae]|uniref:SLBB domain-containing protein n=1 Tax=Fibrella forsythiae TaxID=2817061 RepID=A0ABS3JGY9_9BACT|nr:SLBB domain-containing protein [Fibrella forsythiae]MBO0949271.1 SLBB domain-containing protein [Fibrella forsythiae]